MGENTETEGFEHYLGEYDKISIAKYLDLEGESNSLQISGQTGKHWKDVKRELENMEDEGLVETLDQNLTSRNYYGLTEKGLNMLDYIGRLKQVVNSKDEDSLRELEIVRFAEYGVVMYGGVIAPGETPDQEYAKARVKKADIAGFPEMETVEIVEYLE